MNKVDVVESARLRTDMPPFRPGDQVKVHVNIREGGRERIQVFEGVVIARRGGGLRESFTVRKMSFGVGVERTFPLHAPAIAKLEVVRHGKVRRAKLYYLRELTGKKAKIEERRSRIPTWNPELADEQAEEAPAEEAQAEAATDEVAAVDGTEAASADTATGSAPDDVAAEATTEEAPAAAATDEAAAPESAEQPADAAADDAEPGPEKSE